MSKGSQKKTRSSKTEKYQPLTVGDVQNQYDVKLNANPRMRLSEYAKTINQPNMGKLLEKVETNLAKAH